MVMDGRRRGRLAFFLAAVALFAVALLWVTMALPLHAKAAQVDSWAQLKELAEGAGVETIDVEITGTLVADCTITLAPGAMLRISGGGEIVRAEAFLEMRSAFFIVQDGAALGLEDITLSGGGYVSQYGGSHLVHVREGGWATLGSGAVLKQNTSTAIEVTDGGFAEMRDGAVIEENLRGGVSVDGGSFHMLGGAVQNNGPKRHGCGVHVTSHGSFTMDGGTVAGNAATGNGGGLYVTNSGVITLNGGLVSGNTAEGIGGGVYVNGSGDFFMNGGRISGNTAAIGGGMHARGDIQLNGGYLGARLRDNGIALWSDKDVPAVTPSAGLGTGLFVIENIYDKDTDAPMLNGDTATGTVVAAWTGPGAVPEATAAAFVWLDPETGRLYTGTPDATGANVVLKPFGLPEGTTVNPAVYAGSLLLFLLLDIFLTGG